MYFGGSIMTFALPYGAFIVTATVLFYLYRRPHSGPRLKYLSPAARHRGDDQGAWSRPRRHGCVP